jgi:hypothetical protein
VVRAVYSRWRRLDLPGFLDLSGALDSHPEVYLDCCHVTEVGNQIVAERIAQYLAARLRP